MRGLSSRNLKYMRAFAEAWPIVQQPVAQLPSHPFVQTACCTIAVGPQYSPSGSANGAQGKALAEYARESIRNGWSRNVLVLQIESGLHKRKGKAITNFKSHTSEGAVRPGPTANEGSL